MEPFAEKLRRGGRRFYAAWSRCAASESRALLQSRVYSLPRRVGADAQGDDEPGERRGSAAFSRAQRKFRLWTSPAARLSFTLILLFGPAARRLGRHVMDRCNLTVIFEPARNILPEFFREHEVELVCSLPCYSEENVDKQRGKGTFDASIRALQLPQRNGLRPTGQRG